MIFKFLVILILSTGLFAQSGNFGKNKVQYENFSWRYIESEHFNVYFHEGGEYLANYTAIEAEKALAKISNSLNYDLQMRISFVVYNSHNQFQQNNVIGQFLSEGIGGVTQLFKNNIVIPFQGNYDQFQHVIFHELVHGVLNDMFYGGSFQNAMSGDGFFIPSWLNEGLCEYLSYDGLDPNTDMFMRDIVVTENMVPLQRLDGYIQYRVGQTFYWYIAEKYGKEKVGDFINRLKVQKNLNSAFESSFSMSFADFSERFDKDLKKYFMPDLEKFKDVDDYATPVAKRKQLKNFYNSAPAISPDGEKIAFITDEGGVFTIAKMRIGDKNSVESLVSSFRQQDFEDLNMLSPGISWSPDGKKIAVSAKSGGEDAIFIVNEENGQYEKLAFNLKSIESVVWSPNGYKLAFVASEKERSDIYIYDFLTKKISNLTNDIFSDLNPVWSADSKSIYFISDRTDNTNLDKNAKNFRFWNFNPVKSDVYNITLEDKSITRLTFDPEYKKTSLAISSDNQKLLFVSDENGINNLYLLNKETNKIKPITNSLSSILQISLAKDDSKLVFSTQNEAGYDIYMLRYPLTINLDTDTLPLTKLRSKQKEKLKFLNEIELNKAKIKQDNSSKLQSYDDYQIDFSGSKLVEANPDATKKIGKKDVENLDSLFTSKDYKIKFTPDYVLANGGFSTFFGPQGLTQMQFSDELGEHKINIMGNIFYNLNNSTFFVNYGYLPGIIDYNISLVFQPGLFNIYDDDPLIQGNSITRFRKVALGVDASYPFDLFNRVEFGIDLMTVERTNIAAPFSRNNAMKFLAVPNARYVYDDVLYGMYAPNKGTRANIEFTFSPRMGESGSEFGLIKTDVRNYQRIGNYMSFASRFTGGTSFGRNARRFFVGGTENWINATFGSVDPRLRRTGRAELPLSQPEDFAFLNNFEFPVRGFGIAELTGRNFFATNFEFRFPMFQALVAGPLPILIQGVMGSFFFDMGGAWDNRFITNEFIIDENGNEVIRRKDLMMSAGVGIRSYLLGLPLKVDIAWRNEVYGWSPPNYLFSLGFDF
jgi:Tol biopolymer transport system component